MFELKAYKENLIAYFGRFLAEKGGGIFTTITRKRLLGIDGLSGRDRTKNDFWNDVRKRVKNALVDLNLFISTADRAQVNKVINSETLVQLVRSLLDTRKADITKAEIACLFINEGFYYLQSTSGGNMTLAHGRTIDEATNLANYLVTNYPVKKDIR